MLDRIYPQDRNAKLDYTFDWTPWLTDQSDTIASYVVTAQTGLTVTTSSNDTYTVTIWITIDSNIPKNRLLTLACKITTAAGRVDERTIRIQASDL